MMIDRRHAIMGIACMAAAGSAAALKPRQTLSLAGPNTLEQAIPNAFGDWVAQPSDAIITPDEEDSLVNKVYNQTVGRLYVKNSGEMVMLLIAYGGTQNDLLQLHRPEVCYPAFGFRIDHSAKAAVTLAPRVAIPGRALTASIPQRVEQILYWTRIGEHLPTDGREQRVAKLEDQFAGIIPDGILVRISTIGDDQLEGLALNRRFAMDLISAMAPPDRPMLIGTEAASALPMVHKA